MIPISASFCLFCARYIQFACAKRRSFGDHGQRGTRAGALVVTLGQRHCPRLRRRRERGTALILVTGATGNVGSNVARQLLAAGEEVRALVRNPQTAVVPNGCEVVQGDLTRPETLPGALDGVSRAFLFPVPGTVDAFLSAAKAAGLRHIVLLSSAAVTFQPPNAIGLRHLELERAVAASGLSWTFVRPGAFMANDLNWANRIRAGNVVHGAYGNARTAPIDERDIAAVAVRALLDEKHAGQAYSLTGGEVLSQAERVRIIGEVIGRDVQWVAVSREQAREAMVKVMPPEFADTLLDLQAAQTGPASPGISPVVEEVTGRPPRTYREWVAHHGADFRFTCGGTPPAGW